MTNKTDQHVSEENKPGFVANVNGIPPDRLNRYLNVMISGEMSRLPTLEEQPNTKGETAPDQPSIKDKIKEGLVRAEVIGFLKRSDAKQTGTDESLASMTGSIKAGLTEEVKHLDAMMADGRIRRTFEVAVKPEKNSPVHVISISPIKVKKAFSVATHAKAPTGEPPILQATAKRPVTPELSTTIAPALSTAPALNVIKDYADTHPSVDAKARKTMTAAFAGSDPAKKELWFMINNGRNGFPKNTGKQTSLWNAGFDLLKETAAKGYAPSISDLAFVQYHGTNNVPVNKEEALTNMKKIGFKSEKNMLAHWSPSKKPMIAAASLLKL